MTVFERIYLDANVLIDLAQDQGPVGSLLQIITDSHPQQGREPLFITSELTFSEVLVHPYRDRLESLSKFYFQIRSGIYWLNVIPVTFAVLERAAALRASFKSLRLPDAVHLSTSQLTSCSHFLTNDLGMSSVAETRHPFRDESMPSINVIRANADTLSSILREVAQ
ncbi:MAG: PilT protein [Rhizobium sp.]|nr:PilT protein [Rhizobium sp.]